jgi:hypothetical protein
VKNFIETKEDKIVTIPTVAEAERKLESFKAQLEAAIAQERDLRDSEESLSIKAFDGDQAAKGKLARLDADLNEIVTTQRMLKAAIKRGEANLIEAEAIEARRVALELAETAREIAETQPAIAAALDKSLSDFVGKFGELQEVIIDLERRGFGAGSQHIGYYLAEYFSHVLSMAKIDFSRVHGLPERGANFESIMSKFTGFAHNKTAAVIGDAPVGIPKADVAPAPERLPEGPVLTFTKVNAELDAWNAARTA